jgi:valyl-tRNA synthetase
MSLAKRYEPATIEPALRDQWEAMGVYHFAPVDERPVYSIDTPPPTVSGHLHLGHTYSYSHTDFLARFWRMRGYNVFYPMGFDDNGLPTERLVEKWRSVTAAQIGRQNFIQLCPEVSEEAEKEYEALWKRLGLSIDWRYSYRTIDDNARRTSQWSFLDLWHKGLAYQRKAPTIWCPECQTAIAQAEVDDLERESIFYTLAFRQEDGSALQIATTRPELLPACVAIFVHPADARYQGLLGRQATVPFFGQQVPILADPGADPEKGTGIVMCCTFGDTADVTWWYSHNLLLVEAITPDGRLTDAAGNFAGLTVGEARRQIVAALQEGGWLLEQRPVAQNVRVHERCDTPVEYIVTEQWFVRVLDFKEELLAAGEQIAWYPEHMKARYRQWVEQLGWDWCVSRQRYFGVPFPIWYCDDCQAVIAAAEADLPVDPMFDRPKQPCPQCGSTNFRPETGVMDTWATSSMTPQIVGHWFAGRDDASHPLYKTVFPFSLRPQAHEIIRTWAFYTIVKSWHHFQALPWHNVAISGWGLAPEGTGKISKSRGGGPVAPMAVIQAYSADAVRYWAASTGLGKDSVIDLQRIQAGAKLINKLWNVARFSERFLEKYDPPAADPALSLADRWILARLARLIGRVTALMEGYDYATARSEIEVFFWTELADNYLEMGKKRLYEGGPAGEGATYALYHILLATIQLLAPFLPYVTEAIYQGLFSSDSIHRSQWPQVRQNWRDKTAEAAGDVLVEIATVVRRYKSEAGLSLGAEIGRLYLAVDDNELAAVLQQAEADISSITRAREIRWLDQFEPEVTQVVTHGHVRVLIKD